ncbi:MAG: DUF342 domain-containing protein [Candidatus Hydrogenedentota bacterium]|nr:MAG: DUF342 domain-containing protein [Candidatus Hydrogenedentota bacterium]
MALTKLKKQLLAMDFQDADHETETEVPEELEVLADSLEQALEIGATELQTDISNLDYEILQKGNKGILGVGRIPYKVRIRKMEEDNRWADLEGMDVSLNKAGEQGEVQEEIVQNENGRALVKIYKSGVFLKVIPPKGDGRPVDVESAIDKLHRSGVVKFDRSQVEKAVKEATGELVKVAEYTPRPDADSTLTVEIAPDEMSATVVISAPRPGGRHLTVEEVIAALKASGVEYGFDKEAIEKALDNEQYGVPIIAAKGDKPQDGKDAYIDYKVKIDKKVEFKEDESGRVDFLQKDLVENVVQGQVLAELIPAEKGKPGRTIKNRIIPAKDGKPMEMKPGKGTILSQDGRQIIAEKNGQVVFRGGKLMVEEVYTVTGDVGLDTGNIMFLGSVVVRGSVTDNMKVKAAGNIEIGGNVQKAELEAEGDIVIRQGVQGRDGARIETTGGSITAKFIQNAHIIAEKDLYVSEAIMHSKVEVGGKIVLAGKRAQLVGGEVMAGEEVRCKQLGAQASTPTLVVVGTNPKILQQIKQLEKIKAGAEEKLTKIEQNVRTLNHQKMTQKESFPPEKEEMLVKMLSAQEKLNERLKEADNEIAQLREYMAMLAQNGKVHVEKTLYPGVTIEINNARFECKDEYNHVTLIEENGNIKIVPYEEDKTKQDWRKRRRR